MDSGSVNRLIEKLDILIKLQAASLSDRYQTAKDKILFLSSAGLPPKSIAEILNTSSNFVNVTLSKARKTKKGDSSSSATSESTADG